jgi:hypothetical protein
MEVVLGEGVEAAKAGAESGQRKCGQTETSQLPLGGTTDPKKSNRLGLRRKRKDRLMIGVQSGRGNIYRHWQL